MMPQTIKAAQLVYSNVEAEHSPTGRRGCQVWLWSERLADQQREIARRLEDYEWPDADESQERKTKRLTFFQMASRRDFVIAQTLPLDKRDALRRAGRFHAHALVVSAEEFAKIGNNPFAIIDYFQFEKEPDERINSDRVGNGILEDEISITVGLPKPTNDTAAAVALPTILRWLDQDADMKPIAAPTAPDRLAGFLRGLFRLLPPVLRAKASFDTLSTGITLGTLPYRFVGAFDAATLRDWVGRKPYRIDVETGEFPTPLTPPADPALDHLANEWRQDLALADDERNGSYQLLRSLRDPATKLPERIPDSVIRIVRAAPGVHNLFVTRAINRLAADLTFPSLRTWVEAEAAQWIGGLSAEGMMKLSQQIPLDTLASWLMEKAASQRLTQPQAQELKEWSRGQLKSDKTLGPETEMKCQKLNLMAIRWLPGAGTEIRRRRASVEWCESLDILLREICLSNNSIKNQISDNGFAYRLSKMLVLKPDRVQKSICDDLDLYLATTDAANSNLQTTILNIANACYRSEIARVVEVLGEPVSGDVADWVFGVIEESRPNCFAKFVKLNRTLSPGIAFPCRNKTAINNLINSCISHGGMCRQLLKKSSKWIYNITRHPLVGDDQELRDVRQAWETEGYPGLQEALARISVNAFSIFLSKYAKEKFRFAEIEIDSIESEVIWIGIRPEPRINDPDIEKLWTILVGAATASKPHESTKIAALLAAVL